jgi:GT2 family glycosyltransferase
MDETFFMYGEDIDLNLRFKRLGYRVIYYPEVVIKHLKGTTTRKRAERMIAAFYDAMILFHRKHYSNRYHRIINWLIYLTIKIISKYKLIYAHFQSIDKRVVGSAKK